MRNQDKLEHAAIGFMFAMIASGQNSGHDTIARQAFQAARTFERVKSEQPEFADNYCKCPTPTKNPDLLTHCRECSNEINPDHNG